MTSWKPSAKVSGGEVEMTSWKPSAKASGGGGRDDFMEAKCEGFRGGRSR